METSTALWIAFAPNTGALIHIVSAGSGFAVPGAFERIWSGAW